ncbi:MAG: EAL domain-containing protein [Firmicutes bacterium]|nr:EAL domain-containing protein [Bacillota bacterium]
MNKPYRKTENNGSLRTKLIGLGEKSFQKNYYPELQRKVDELERFRTLLDYSNDAILIVKLPTGNLNDVNQSACYQLGYSREELVQMTFADIMSPSSYAAVASIFNNHNDKQYCKQLLNVSLKRRDGTEIPVEITLCFKQFVNNIYALVVARDITERKQAEEKIRFLAYHDYLTNLPNRLYFTDRLKETIKKAEKDRKDFSVLFLDLDRFKRINDTLGHNAGDELLKAVAQRLLTLVKGKDVLARMGGDEFSIILADKYTKKDLFSFMNQIYNILHDPFIYEGYELSINVSIGVAIYPEDGLSADSLLKNADSAMYMAKEQVGNAYSFYHKSINSKNLKQLSLESSLRFALERQEFSLYYQPIISVEKGIVVGTECLIRWNHPEHGLLNPSAFIPVAEETGLIINMGDWVLKNACMQNILWQGNSIPELHLAVNLSNRQFYNPNLPDRVAEILKVTGMKGHHLSLEITENTAMYNEDFAADMLSRLKQLGVKIYLDDFGTGYSSLSHLKQFSIDGLKIDRTFINDISTNNDSKAIVKAAIALAKNLKLEVIVEGVETKDQLKLLQSYGCDKMQGYLFSKPIPHNEFHLFLQKDIKGLLK